MNLIKALEWAFSRKAPWWVDVLATVGAVGVTLGFVILTAYLLSLEHYLAVVLLWIISPLCVVWLAYNKRE